MTTTFELGRKKVTIQVTLEGLQKGEYIITPTVLFTNELICDNENTYATEKTFKIGWFRRYADITYRNVSTKN